jgi:hypothetical protein
MRPESSDRDAPIFYKLVRTLQDDIVRLKIRVLKGSVGSSPTPGTNSVCGQRCSKWDNHSLDQRLRFVCFWSLFFTLDGAG